MCFGSSACGLCSVSGLEKQKNERKKKPQPLNWVSTVLFTFVDSSTWDLCIDRGEVGKNICLEHMSLKNNVTS